MTARDVRRVARLLAIAMIVPALLVVVAVGAEESGAVDEDALFGAPAGGTDDGGTVDEDALFGAPAGGADDGGTVDEDALFGAPAGGADDGGTLDEDALFGAPVSSDGAGGGALVTDVAQSSAGLDAFFLTSDAPSLSGRYSFSLGSSWAWDGLSGLTDAPFTFLRETFSSRPSMRIALDARPAEDLRLFAKGTLGWDGEPNVVVEEIFGDVAWNDAVFVRAGKQTLNWGVGYLFRPADLLNLTEVDPEDPEADLEGPVAVRAHLPFGTANYYAYLLPEFATAIDEVGVAVRAEWLVGSGEIGIGAVYRSDIAPASMTTASFSWRDFDIVAEAVVSRGSDRTFVTLTEAVPGVETVATERRDEELFAKATAGFRWSDTWGDERETGVSALVQYLYNGEGYADTSIFADYEAQILGLVGTGTLTFGDITDRSIHTAAGSVSFSSILESDFGVSLFVIHGFNERSGRATATLSWSPLDRMSLSVTPGVTYGTPGTEFNPKLPDPADPTRTLGPAAEALSLSINLSVAGGSF